MDVAIREYDIPYYRMRALYRRLDALMPHVAGRKGLSLSYSATSSVADSHASGLFSESFRYRLEHVRLEDGIQPKSMRILAVVSRDRKTLLPLSHDAEDSDGIRIPTVENGVMTGGWTDDAEQLEGIFGDHDESVLSDRWNALMDSFPRCSCCGQSLVDKSETYLVATDDGSVGFGEVGSCCLSKYANGLPSQYATSYANILGRMTACSLDGKTRHLPFEANLLRADRVIAYALAQIDSGGYPIAHARAYDTVGADRSWLMGIGDGSGSKDRLRAASQRLDEARKAWAWAKGGLLGTPDTSWARHARLIAKESKWDLIEGRDYGTVASLAIPWHRKIVGEMMNRDSRWMKPRGSEWVGVPGETLRTRIVKAYPIMRRLQSVNGMSMTSTMWGLLTDDGDILIWNTTTPQDLSDGLAEGKRMTMTGKVVNHGEYNGTRQTTVKRCRLEDEDKGVA